ncbi:MAG: phosphomannomutase/phosphoglucomutase [Prevotellaceae bacterium]|jgi:phosphomannomutase|nr:phosphomannomutase/phosphoglucomutase [Prevotellaceae bacterium]
MGAFHAYDIRGVYGIDFGAQEVYRIGYFLPKLLGVKKVLVGRDARLSSDEIHESLLRGICDAGADVYDIGLSTTPQVYYATAKYDFGASVQITASHNSKEYNGLKISRAQAMPVGYDSGLNLLEAWIGAGNPAAERLIIPSAQSGKVIPFSVRDEYLTFLRGYLGDYSNLKIGIDLSNGMAALFIKELLGETPSYIFDTLDGTFPNHDPNPLIPKNIKSLQELVVKEQCDIGIIFDGDADRVMCIDETGCFISPDLIIGVLGHYFLEEKGLRGPVLQDIRTSKAVGEYLTPMGGEMHTWRVGRAFAAPKLREINGIYGGELAGHYYFKDFFYSDSGIMAMLIILDVVGKMKDRGISVSQLIGRIGQYHNSGEINYKIDNKQEAMELIRDHFVSKETPVSIYDFDGYRVEFADWWFNIRPSNTEPYLRFIAEARSKVLLQEKLKTVNRIIQSI